MRESILTVLARGEPILLDGAFGTLLFDRGLPAGTMPEEWLLTHSAEIVAAHAAYVVAGAQCITTNTLGGSSIRLREARLQDSVREINRIGAALAREAAGNDVWVAGSVGPTGRLLEPLGDLSIADTEAAFAEQVVGLAEGGADLILIETQHDLEEACCALRMAKRLTSLPAMCTFSFNPRGRTMMGLRLSQAAAQCADQGADGIGANCGDGPEAVLAALNELCNKTSLPIVAQANAGIPRASISAETVWDVTPALMADYARQFIAAGAQIVGGCCGTTPQFIEILASVVR